MSTLLNPQLSNLKVKIRDARRTVASMAISVVGATSGAHGALELRQLDKELAKARREIYEMRETLESHSHELELEQRLQNMSRELTTRLEKQSEENATLDRIINRQSTELAGMGMNDTQKREFDRLKAVASELHEQLRAEQVRSAELSRQQHHASLQWSKACARQERIRRGLASNEAGGGNERAIGTTGNATRKLDARLDHARRAVKVAIQSGVGQTRRHQQVCTHLLAAQTMRDYTS